VYKPILFGESGTKQCISVNDAIFTQSVQNTNDRNALQINGAATSY